MRSPDADPLESGDRTGAMRALPGPAADRRRKHVFVEFEQFSQHGMSPMLSFPDRTSSLYLVRVDGGTWRVFRAPLQGRPGKLVYFHPQPLGGKTCLPRPDFFAVLDTLLA